MFRGPVFDRPAWPERTPAILIRLGNVMQSGANQLVIELESHFTFPVAGHLDRQQSVTVLEVERNTSISGWGKICGQRRMVILEM